MLGRKMETRVIKKEVLNLKPGHVDDSGCCASSGRAGNMPAFRWHLKEVVFEQPFPVSSAILDFFEDVEKPGRFFRTGCHGLP